MTDALFTPQELTAMGRGVATYTDALNRRVRALEAQLSALTGGEPDAVVSTLSVPALYKTGLITTPTTTTITVGVGACAPSTGAGKPITLASAITKSLNAFSAGNGGGGLTSAVLPSTWNHVFAVDDGAEASDVIFDPSATSPAIPAPYSRARRVASFLTDGSSLITPYEQNGSHFFWETPPLDVNQTSTGIVAVDRVLTVPLGVVSRALLAVLVRVSSGGSSVLGRLSPKSVADVDPNTAPNIACVSISAALNQVMHWIECDTDANQTVRSRMNVSGLNNTLFIYTSGWVDYFGETA